MDRESQRGRKDPPRGPLAAEPPPPPRRGKDEWRASGPRLTRELEPRESGKEGKHCGKADRGKATWPFGNSLHHRVSLSVK